MSLLYWASRRRRLSETRSGIAFMTCCTCTHCWPVQAKQPALRNANWRRFRKRQLRYETALQPVLVQIGQKGRCDQALSRPRTDHPLCKEYVLLMPLREVVGGTGACRYNLQETQKEDCMSSRQGNPFTVTRKFLKSICYYLAGFVAVHLSRWLLGHAFSLGDAQISTRLLKEYHRRYGWLF